jgi:hypothetical protein
MERLFSPLARLRLTDIKKTEGGSMSKVIDQERFAKPLFEVLEETFETNHGIYLDKGTSLFETLDAITAAEASRPVGGKCASLAAQVAHVTFYLEVLERYIRDHDVGAADWGEVWRTVKEVTPDEWTALRHQLRQTYQRILTMLRGLQTWDDEAAIEGPMAVAVHTAYHLGEIRQALCILR